MAADTTCAARGLWGSTGKSGLRELVESGSEGRREGPRRAQGWSGRQSLRARNRRTLRT